MGTGRYRSEHDVRRWHFFRLFNDGSSGSNIFVDTFFRIELYKLPESCCDSIVVDKLCCYSYKHSWLHINR